MNERKKFNFSTVLLYILLFIAMFALYYVGGNGEPFSLALLYAMLAAGLNPVLPFVRAFWAVGLYPAFPARLCGTGGHPLHRLLRLCEIEEKGLRASARLRRPVAGAFRGLFALHPLQYPAQATLLVGRNHAENHSFGTHPAAFRHVHRGA